jgi:hypothetical protein
LFIHSCIPGDPATPGVPSTPFLPGNPGIPVNPAGPIFQEKEDDFFAILFFNSLF